MKKKFAETKVGKLLTSNVGRGLIGLIPVAGTPIKNILTQVNGDGRGEVISEAGTPDIKTLINDLVKVLIYIAIYYMSK